MRPGINRNKDIIMARIDIPLTKDPKVMTAEEKKKHIKRIYQNAIDVINKRLQNKEISASEHKAERDKQYELFHDALDKIKSNNKE